MGCHYENRVRAEQGTSESNDSSANRDQVKLDKIAQVPCGEVFQSLEIHPEEFVLCTFS